MKAIIVYATGSGNTRLVVECVGAGLEQAGFEVKLARVEKSALADTAGYDLIVLASSTWEVGKLHPYYTDFAKELEKAKLKDKPMAVIGLGDGDHYDIFCGAADVLETLVLKAGAYQVVPTLRINGPPHAKLDDFQTWGKNLAAEFQRQVTH